MTKYPAGETPTTIRNHSGISGNRFGIVLAALVDDGTVIQCEIIKGNQKTPRPAYKLVEG